MSEASRGKRGEVDIGSTSRRDMLRLSIAGGALALGGTAPGGRLEAQTVTRVRKDVHTLPDDAVLVDPILVTYRAAVNYMKNLPSSDRRSWAYQADIHNNWCTHGNWYLLPWHREYLLAIENIIRGLPVVGASNFAMPYWNWTRNRQLPAALTRATLSDGSPNPLYDGTRQVAPDASVPEELTRQGLMDSIYGQTRFESFGSSRPTGQNDLSGSWQRRTGTYGQLEATPHNGVHTWIRGNMGSRFSPLDPIFWLHHGNIDRIWASWNAQGNANTSDGLWRNFVFRQNFARPDGVLYDRAVRDVSMSAYSYDRLDPRPGTTAALMLLPESEWFEVAALGDGPAVGQLRGIFRVSNDRGAMLGQPASIPVDLQGKGSQLSSRALLRLLDIEAPSVANPPFVRVFVNHPTIGPNTPPSGAYYVGTVAFFDTHAQQHAAGHVSSGARLFSFELSLTPTIEKLRGLGKMRDTLTVQIVPVSLGTTVQQVGIKPRAVEIEFY
jgi:tyrosinase